MLSFSTRVGAGCQYGDLERRVEYKLGDSETTEVRPLFAGKTFINIIESPSTADRESDRSEGKMLTAALDLAELPYLYSLVSNYQEFMTALGRWAVDEVARERVPVMHLSMHGSPRGLMLTDGHFLPWADLNWKFRMINQKLNHILVVCLSSCHGLSGLQMLREDAYAGLKQPPFRLLVSNLKRVPWSDAAIAFATFYHLLERGKNPLEMVTAMRAASVNNGFFGLLIGNEPDQQVIVLGSDQLRKAVDTVA